MARNLSDYTVTQAAAITAQRKARSAMSRALTLKLAKVAEHGADSATAKAATVKAVKAEAHFAACKRTARLLTGADKPSGPRKASEAKMVSEARKVDADHAARGVAQEKANEARAQAARATVAARETAQAS